MTGQSSERCTRDWNKNLTESRPFLKRSEIRGRHLAASRQFCCSLKKKESPSDSKLVKDCLSKQIFFKLPLHLQTPAESPVRLRLLIDKRTFLFLFFFYHTPLSSSPTVPPPSSNCFLFPISWKPDPPQWHCDGLDWDPRLPRQGGYPPLRSRVWCRPGC